MHSSRPNPIRTSAHGMIATAAAVGLCGSLVPIACRVSAVAAATSSTSTDSQAKQRDGRPAPRSDNTAAHATTSIASKISG